MSRPIRIASGSGDRRRSSPILVASTWHDGQENGSDRCPGAPRVGSMIVPSRLSTDLPELSLPKSGTSPLALRPRKANPSILESLEQRKEELLDRMISDESIAQDLGLEHDELFTLDH